MFSLRLTLIFFSFIIAGNIIAQVNHEQTFVKPEPWDIGCDSFSTQLEMNVCSYNSFMIADSVLTARYSILLAFLDNAYKRELADAGDSSNAQKRYVEALKQEKRAAIESQKAFLVYRNNMTDIISCEYSEGSIRPLIVNMYALNITRYQIKLLNEMIEEIVRY